jgi:hypothetical protein
MHSTAARPLLLALLALLAGACSGPGRAEARSTAAGLVAGGSGREAPRDACVLGEDGAGACPTAAPAEARAVPVLEPVLASGNRTAFRDLVLPTAEERAWEQIDWLPSFGQGVAAAAAGGRPLLVWVMNGHPLGCT